MRKRSSVALAVSSLLISVSGGGVQAQTIQFKVSEVALKSGESAELGDVFYVSASCKSLLKATPEVEILDGPPGVTAEGRASISWLRETRVRREAGDYGQRYSRTKLHADGAPYQLQDPER